jgi:hypothetical protein
MILTDANNGRQSMNFMDDPFSRDLKRIEVARRMVSHQVRTQTIVDYTSLTRNCLATLRRRWCVAEDSRRRGPPPRSIGVLLRTPRARSEAAAVISLCIAFEALPGNVNSEVGTRPRLMIADRLCEALETLRTWIPHSTVEFEELLLLATELATGDLVELSHCRACRCVILSLKEEVTSCLCVHCEERGTTARATVAAIAVGA